MDYVLFTGKLVAADRLSFISCLMLISARRLQHSVNMSDRNDRLVNFSHPLSRRRAASLRGLEIPHSFQKPLIAFF